MAIGHKLSLRLFLEGVEVPCIGAAVSSAPNSPATASIQIIATNEIFNILPRTVVHLFFYDFVDATNPISQVKKGNQYKGGIISNTVRENPQVGRSSPRSAPPSQDESPSTLLSEEQKLYSQYKVLFMGEVQGIQFVKDPGNRSVILTCVDFSNYWDTTYQYNFNGSIIGGRREAAFIGANANLFTSPLGHGEGTISALLRSKSVNFPKLKGLLAGIVRVLESIGGCYYTENGFKGANPFCSIAELRLKLLQQISAVEADTSTANLFSEKTFAAWMNRSIGGLGKLVTFRGLIQVMERFIYHEVYPLPSPMFLPEQVQNKQVTTNINLIQDPSSALFAGRVTDVLNAAVKLQVALQPFLQELSSGFSSTSSGAEVLGAVSSLNGLYRLLADVRPPSKFPGLSAKVQVIGRLVSHVKNQLRYTGSSVNVATPSKVQNAYRDLVKIITLCEEILGKSVRRARVITSSKVARVNNQIFRPDIWYAPPPRCNVLFPELYNSLQWSRNFMREVSRLELQSTNAILGDNALFNARYYAPDVPDMRRGVKLSERAFGQLIMAHELYTGIIPMYEKMTELNLFGMQSKGNDAILQMKVGYGQRAVNHQYFKHRFSSRAMQATGRFNPWVVPGFPTLIVDRPLTQEQLYEAGAAKNVAELQEIVAPQLLGTCIQVNHNVSQQGGETSYVFAQARVHRETAEYLGVDNVYVSKAVGNATRYSVIFSRSEEVPKKGSVGPLGGTVAKDPEEVTAQFVGKTKLLYPRNVVSYRMEFPTSGSAPRAYKVVERITRRTKRNLQNVPIEDAIRPPWIWKGWHNAEIGETYESLIGTDSIVDVSGFDVADDPFEQAPSNEGTELVGDSEPGAVVYNPNDQEFKTLITLETDVPEAAQPVVARPRINRISTNDQQTVEASVDVLVKLYSTIRAQGLDVGNFIRMYTWRPIATMLDILGSPDLTYREDGAGHVVVATGTEGFHSRAFGDRAGLFGLVNPQVTKVLGLSEKKNHAALASLDVRPDRRQVIKTYVYELNNSRGLLG